MSKTERIGHKSERQCKADCNFNANRYDDDYDDQPVDFFGLVILFNQLTMAKPAPARWKKLGKKSRNARVVS